MFVEQKEEAPEIRHLSRERRPKAGARHIWAQIRHGSVTTLRKTCAISGTERMFVRRPA
jgi:hypothetical protein